MQTIGYKSNADVGMKRGETISLEIAKLKYFMCGDQKV